MFANIAASSLVLMATASYIISVIGGMNWGPITHMPWMQGKIIKSDSADIESRYLDFQIGLVKVCYVGASTNNTQVCDDLMNGIIHLQSIIDDARENSTSNGNRPSFVPPNTKSNSLYFSSMLYGSYATAGLLLLVFIISLCGKNGLNFGLTLTTFIVQIVIFSFVFYFMHIVKFNMEEIFQEMKTPGSNFSIPRTGAVWYGPAFIAASFAIILELLATIIFGAAMCISMKKKYDYPVEF